jgi:hypothetical protein
MQSFSTLRGVWRKTGKFGPIGESESLEYAILPFEHGLSAGIHFAFCWNVWNVLG